MFMAAICCVISFLKWSLDICFHCHENDVQQHNAYNNVIFCSLSHFEQDSLLKILADDREGLEWQVFLEEVSQIDAD